MKNDNLISELSINTIRTIAMDSVEKAQHGHPGMPMGAAPMAYSLWKKVLNINPSNPKRFNRDRFILSAGHGSLLQYILLHLSGFDLSLDEIKRFRQWNSKTPGHPEYGITPGVEATTGPLGQGIPQSVGMALAERHLAETYNKDDFPIVDHFTYTICGDGDLMEGVSYEAASFAGHVGLGRLIVLYDSNDISLDGDLNRSFSEDIQKRFESMNWHYLLVENGNDVDAVEKAIIEGKAEQNKPTIIEIKTIIGYGAPTLQGTSDIHSDPIGAEEIKKAKEFYGWEYEDFHVPKEVYTDFETIQKNGEEKEKEWDQLFEQYKEKYPDLARELKRIIVGDFSENWNENLPLYTEGEVIATRASGSEILNALATNSPELVGGSADLDASTKTRLTKYDNFTKSNYAGRNVMFGVREFAMGGIANGMALHYLRPFVSTFFVFSDYLRPAIRLSALMNVPVIYVFTHDSIAVGQDGPTHQPVEQLAAFRAMPNLSVIRPADANETKEAWKIALTQKDRPTMIVLGRQGLPTLENTNNKIAEGVKKGAYVISEAKEEPSGILIAAGSEVSLAIKAQSKLADEKIHVTVVSMPSWDLFEKQTEEYKKTILPDNIQKRLTIEMGSKLGWREYAGTKGSVMSIDTFGAAGPGEEVIEKYGFTVENVIKHYKEIN